MSLSERQKKILAYISQFTEENGYPPTVREIGAAVGITSTSVVNYNLDVLKNAGYLNRRRDVSRGITLTEEKFVTVPILGTIAAGRPIPVPNSDFSPYDYETLTLPVELVKPKDRRRPEDGLFALHVSGDSMIDALIDDGDLVIMKRVEGKEEIRNGDMVAVRLVAEDATTLKYFFLEGKEDNQVRLQPANPAMAPIYTPASNVIVQAKLVSVFRQFS